MDAAELGQFSILHLQQIERSLEAGQRFQSSHPAGQREWLALQRKKLARATFANAGWTFETLVLPYMGSRPISKLGAVDVLKVLKRIEGRGIPPQWAAANDDNPIGSLSLVCCGCKGRLLDSNECAAIAGVHSNRGSWTTRWNRNFDKRTRAAGLSE